MKILATSFVIALAAATICGEAAAADCGVGNLGYNSFEGYLSQGTGLDKHFGPGVGYPASSGDYFQRYLKPQDWGQYRLWNGSSRRRIWSLHLWRQGAYPSGNVRSAARRLSRCASAFYQDRKGQHQSSAPVQHPGNPAGDGHIGGIQQCGPGRKMPYLPAFRIQLPRPRRSEECESAYRLR